MQMLEKIRYLVGKEVVINALKHTFAAKLYFLSFNNIKYFCQFAFLVLILAQSLETKGQIQKKDTLQKKKIQPLLKASDTLSISSKTAADTSKKKKVKGDIQTKVVYKCQDSLKFDVDTRKVYMFEQSDITYGEINLKSAYGEFDMKNNNAYAKGRLDTSGKEIGTPVFTQGADKYQAKSMKYNFKSKRALISGVVTQQGEGFLHGENVKKNPENSLYVKNARYTTCNLEHPHFFIESKKIKAIPNNKMITGPFNLVFGDFPTPLGFLFGIFPTPKNRSSGIIIPTYGEAQDRGFFLRNGGYYWAASEHVGFKFLGDIYSKGSYGFSMLSNYKNRYHYDGSFDLRYNKRLEGEGDLALTGEDFWVSWSHRPETRGTSSFSASVNGGTNSYNRRNSFDPNNYLSSSFSSNISYAKTFQGTPFSLAINARQQQNVQTRQMSLDLPDVALNMNRIYPFKREGSSGNTWYERINFAYNLNARNSISNAPVSNLNVGNGVRVINERSPLMDSTLRIKSNTFNLLLDRMQNGMRHTIPVSTSFTLFKFLQVAPAFNYNESWYLRRLDYTYVADSQKVNVDTINRFSRAFSYNMSASMQTRVYGVVYVRKLGIEAIRHVMNPSISFGYTPDFTSAKFGMMKRVQVGEKNGQPVYQLLNPFQNSLFGGPTAGRSGSVGFSLTNNFEMKIKNKEDTTGKNPFKKVTLLDNLNFGSSYNLLADSFQLANINIGARTRILDRFDINFGGVIDPYRIISIGKNAAGEVLSRRVNKLYMSDLRSFGRLSILNLNFSTSLNPAARKKKTLPQKQLSSISESQIDFINANPELYVAWDVPWNLSVNYNLTYSKPDLRKATTVQSVNFFGDINLTQKWKIGASSGFDFINKSLTFTNINLYRDLHCWEMRMNWIPFGQRQSYSVDINVKASVLQDLKLSRRRSWFDR